MATMACGCVYVFVEHEYIQMLLKWNVHMVILIILCTPCC